MGFRYDLDGFYYNFTGFVGLLNVFVCPKDGLLFNESKNFV